MSAGRTEPVANAETGSPPLAGVRVLDLTRLLPGGYCTYLLAFLGADVVKVEDPWTGDYSRWMPPFQNGESVVHRHLNHGKRSITLNLKTDEGVAILLRLVAGFDVLVESFRPGVMARLGVGPEALFEANARLIYCPITGYGQAGPMSGRAGHDINYLAEAGLLALTGAGPTGLSLPPVQIADLAGGGMSAAVGILAALSRRIGGSGGVTVDVSMLDGVLAWLMIPLATFLATAARPTAQQGPLTGGYACYRTYRAADGRHLAVGALEPKFWGELCQALDRRDMINDQYGPPERQAEMAAALQQAFSHHSADEWFERLAGLDVCVSAVRDLGDVATQVLAQRDRVDPDGRVSGMPFRLEPGAREMVRPAPGFGEHTEMVMAELGMTPQDVARMRASGVLGPWPAEQPEHQVIGPIS